MLYAIIADIHANLAAFSAVLEDIKSRGEIEEIWCLGDVVGYGPDPHECIELLKQHKHVCIAGNHDMGATGKIDTHFFNPNAAAVCEWTSQQLSREDIKYLENLPTTLETGDFTLVHGSPREPIWEYMISISGAKENFSYFQSKYCLIGHSHMPLTFRKNEDGVCSFAQFNPDIRQIIGKDRMIINPGAVGQPRDGDPRASYALYDTEISTIRLHRVQYNIEATQNKMTKLNLPLPLVSRLSFGK